MKKNEYAKKILWKAALTVVLLLVVLSVIGIKYVKYRQKEKQIHSRYTYTITVDDEDANNITKISKKWLDGFTKQFVGIDTTATKRLRSVSCETPEILDYNNNIVLLRFSAEVVDSSSEFFSTWNGVITDGRLNCEWVVTFGMAQDEQGKAIAYVSSSVSPEEYGISQYNAQTQGKLSGSEDASPSKSESSIYNYKISNDILQVTFDGGSHYVNVPVSVDNLMLNESEDESAVTGEKHLSKDSYCLNSYFAAFVVGGNNISGTKTPVTVVYSVDGGDSWVTSTVEKIYDANYFYINFFDDKEGILVVGYGKNDTKESSRIYSTTKGGEEWVSVGSGPTNNIIKGAMFTDINTGFFCYDYSDGMDSNLYRTNDGGKSFSKIMFEAQQLDSVSGNSDDNVSSGVDNKLTWNSVYKEALVPIKDSGNVITVYLTQGNGGVYNNGKTAAKFQSQDNGDNWKYIGQVELTTGS